MKYERPILGLLLALLPLACKSTSGDDAQDMGGVEKTSVSSGVSGESSAIGKEQPVELASGKRLRGTILSDDGLALQIELPTGEQRTIPYTDLAPKSVYRFTKARVNEQDALGQLELANVARDAGLTAHAQRHYAAALKADPSLEGQVAADLGKLRVTASEEALSKAKASLEKGKNGVAYKQLNAVVTEFGEERAAQEASMLLADLDTERAAAHEAEMAKHDAEVLKALDPARKDYDKAVEDNRKGLLAAKKLSSAVKHFESSVKKGESARKKIAKVQKDSPDDDALLTAAQALDDKVVELIVQTDLNLASVYMTRSSYPAARGAVNHALAIDPKNPEAKDMSKRVDMAASNQGGGFWYIGN